MSLGCARLLSSDFDESAVLERLLWLVRGVVVALEVGRYPLGLRDDVVGGRCLCESPRVPSVVWWRRVVRVEIVVTWRGGR